MNEPVGILALILGLLVVVAQIVELRKAFKNRHKDDDDKGPLV